MIHHGVRTGRRMAKGDTVPNLIQFMSEHFNFSSHFLMVLLHRRNEVYSCEQMSFMRN